MSKLNHVCQCTEHKFDRKLFDDLPGVIGRTVDAIANASHTRPAAPNIYIPKYSRTESPHIWDSCTSIEHAWHPSLVARFKLHPIIDAMLAYRPTSVAQLALEWPHVADSDGEKLAYTRDDAKGHADIQTTTSIGKYVSRHWPLVPDHIRRDVCSLYTADETYFVEPNVEAFIEAVDTGPVSCMQDGWNGRRPWPIHPYAVYNPAHGWGMAVRKSNGSIDARALTCTHKNGDKVFVRAYSRSESGGYSKGDTALTAWLVSQGFEHGCSFKGARFDEVRGSDGQLVAPYIDGGDKHIDSTSDGTFEIVSRGDYECDNTDGTVSGDDEEEEEDTSIGQCEDCDNTVGEEDDYSYVGYCQDNLVCSSCCQRSYTFVTGANRQGFTSEYTVSDDDVVTVHGTQYDVDRLPSNICQLEDGGHFDTQQDDHCVINAEYYLCDDSRVVKCADGEWALKEDCWKCAESGEWYSNDEDFVDVDGETYHADSLAALRAAEQVAPLFPEPVPTVDTSMTASEYISTLAPAPAWPFVKPEMAIRQA